MIALEEIPGELLVLELTGAAYHIYIFDEEFSGEESVLLHTFAGEEFSINNKAELYNILGNELALPPGTCLEAAGDSILDILREKELLEIVSNNKASNEESIPPPNGCRRELFIAGSFPGELVDHLVKRVGIEGVIIWQDFINGINGITGRNDPATCRAWRGLFSKLKLLELINKLQQCLRKCRNLSGTKCSSPFQGG